jgi:hypothetical protein
VQVLEAMKSVLEVEHPWVLNSINNLAFTWKGQGRDTEALELMQEYVQLRIRVLGVDHPNTNSSSAA